MMGPYLHLYPFGRGDWLFLSILLSVMIIQWFFKRKHIN